MWLQAYIRKFSMIRLWYLWTARWGGTWVFLFLLIFNFEETVNSKSSALPDLREIAILEFIAFANVSLRKVFNNRLQILWLFAFVILKEEVCERVEIDVVSFCVKQNLLPIIIWPSLKSHCYFSSRNYASSRLFVSWLGWLTWFNLCASCSVYHLFLAELLLLLGYKSESNLGSSLQWLVPNELLSMGDFTHHSEQSVSKFVPR